MKIHLAALLALGLLCNRDRIDIPPEFILPVPQKPAGIGTSENPQARLDYELDLLADPATGRIPAHIRTKELAFSRTLPLNNHATRRMTTGEYEPAGPFNVGGRTRAVLLDIRDENTIIAGGVSGGIWKTTNGGSSWERTSDPALRNSVTAMAQDVRPGHENTWYFGTGELIGNSARSLAAPYRGDGIYKSVDSGNSWFQLESTAGSSPDEFSSQFQYIWNIETNHLNEDEDEVLVAAYGGILKSTDGGDNWEVLLGQRLFDLPDDADLNTSDAPFYTSLRKTPSGRFAASLSSASSADTHSLQAGLYLSVDGAHWTEVTPSGFPEYHERTVMGFSSDEQSFYFLTEGSAVTLWRFDVSEFTAAEISGTWTDLSDNIPRFGGSYGDYLTQVGYNMVVEVHPEDPELIFIGGTNLYRSTDGFTSERNTKWIGGYHPENTGAVYPGHYPDQHLLLFYPSDPDKMLSANDGGLRMTRNNRLDSVDWISLNRGYITSQFYTIFQQKDEATDLILGGMQDNGSYLRDAVGLNPAWTRLLGGDGGYCAITPGALLFYISFQESQIYRLELTRDNQLRSFARVDPVGGGESGEESLYLFINPFVLDPLNANRMFLAGGDFIWRNDNLVQIPGGSQNKTAVNWVRLSGTKLLGGIYSALEKSPSADILYAGAFQPVPLVLKIEDASSNAPTFTKLYSSLFPEGGHISCIAVHPEDAGHLVVVFSNYNIPSVFLSTDGGLNFTDISGNLEQFPDGTGDGPSVRWVEIVPTTEGITYFAGTSTGLYSTSEIAGTNTTWAKEASETIGNAVIPMLDYRDVDGRLVIATHGSGTFRMFLPNARPFNTPQPGAQLALEQNFPNPFSEETTIEFTLPSDQQARIDIYNSSGQLIKNLIWGPQFAGTNRVRWDGTNAAGIRVTPGMYFYRISYGKSSLSGAMLFRPI